MFSSVSFFTEDLHKFRSYKAFSKYTKYNVLFFCLSKIVFRWAAQIAHQGQLAHHIGKRQVSGVVTPGNIPGLVPGSAAAAQWWDFLKFWQELFTLQCTRITFFSHPNITVCQQSPRITTLVIVSLQLPTLTNREINATQNSFSESAGFHFPRPCWICVWTELQCPKNSPHTQVGCPDRPPGSARPPHWQEAGFWCCHPWKHPRTCPWICCRCSVVRFFK